MLTSKIEQKADIGGISSPDLDLPYLLRREVCPMFMHDVGYVGWRRIVLTFNTIIGTRQYALPTDFEIASLVTIPSLSGDGLPYIGESPEKLSKATASTTNATPTGYYLDYDSATGVQNKLSFDSPPSAAVAVNLIYYRTTYFADDTTAVEMDKFVPPHFQSALVNGLRMAICFHRFGIGDPRYIAAEDAYSKTVGRAADNKELARRNNPVFAR